jgi:hypothetical protein
MQIMDSVPKKKKMRTLDSYFSNNKTEKVSFYIQYWIICI